MNKKALTERDICTKFITPNIVAAGWNSDTQIREEVSFTDGRIYVRGKLHARGTKKRADYILYYKPNIPIAVIDVAAGANMHEFGRFEIADVFCDVDSLNASISGTNESTPQISIWSFER